MIKGIAIFFLSVYLLASTPIGQICKLSTLVEHFKKHHKENKELGFIAFLKMHYFNGDPKDADYDEDMKLPFKSVSSENSTSSFINFDNPTCKIENQTFSDFTVKKYFQSDNWHSNTYLEAIWQPPRSI